MAKCAWGKCRERAEAKLLSVSDLLYGIILGSLCGFHKIEAEELINTNQLKDCRVVSDFRRPRKPRAGRTR